jgi:hypothetical protein
MFDIFTEQKEPKLYIADITIKYALKGKGVIVKGRTTDLFSVKKIHDYPMLLLNDKPPSKNYEESLIERLTTYLSVGFKPNTVTLQSISNIRFSSNINYEFNFND